MTDHTKALADALEALLAGNEWRCLQGEWAWHAKQIPSNAALTKGREALAAYRAAQQAEPAVVKSCLTTGPSSTVGERVALVPVETLDAWKSMANSLAVLSLKSERARVAVELKQLIQAEIDDAQPAAQAEPAAQPRTCPDGQACVDCCQGAEPCRRDPPAAQAEPVAPADWRKLVETAYDLGKRGRAIDELEAELSDTPAQAAPVAYEVWWGLGEMRRFGSYESREKAEAIADGIRSNTEVREVHAPSNPPAQAEPATVGERATAGELLTKLPTLDLSWPADVRDRWHRCFNALLHFDPNTPQPAAQGIDEREGFATWANRAGYDTAHTYDTDRSRWVFLNPMTADLWTAWQARAAQAPAAEPLGAAIAPEYDEALAQHAADAEKWFARDMQDAVRYRWLRENSTEYKLTQKDGYGGRELLGWEELDAAIDAALAQAQKEQA